MSLAEYAKVTGICWLSGLVVGTFIYFAVEGPLSLEWWVFFPFAMPAAAVMTLPYAAIAGLLACIALLLAQDSLREASAGKWVTVGTGFGVVVGACHPLNLLGALVGHLVDGPHLELSKSFLAASAGAGAVAGAAVARWYRARLVRLRPSPLITEEAIPAVVRP